MGRGTRVPTGPTIDEELNLLNDQLRRLKIEYEIFFNNPTKRPPADIEWRVQNMLRRFSDGVRLNFAQRYRYNEMAQRYAIQSDLWRKKLRIREEGYRRPQDAVLSVQGAGGGTQRPEARHVYGVSHGKPDDAPFSIQCSNSGSEREKIESLYKALNAAKQSAGEAAGGSFDSFAAFVKKKTGEIRKQHGCESVEYSVEMQDGHARLKARAKK
jgi:hypothetical protein